MGKYLYITRGLILVCVAIAAVLAYSTGSITAAAHIAVGIVIGVSISKLDETAKELKRHEYT